MKLKKTILISRYEPSSWKSCQSIVANLKSAYTELFGADELIHLNVPSELNSYQAYKIIQQLNEHQPEVLIWIDHAPSPATFLAELNRFYQGERKPDLLIHLFGDFVIDCLKWKKVEKELKEWKVHFITASERQLRLVQQFVRTHDQVSCIPFPVDTSFFNSSDLESRRGKIRSRFNVGSDEKMFLYTGRVSFQKNIELLIKSFASLEKLWKGKATLWISGPLDDILLPYKGKHGLPGSFFTHLFYNSDCFNGQIRYLGNLSPEELKDFYSAADVFVSPSTYNDEDFGMSPAEALCMGLDCILSDWGGYTSFKNYCDGVELVKVQMDEERPNVDGREWQKTLAKKMFSPNSPVEERVLRSQKAAAHLSVEAIAEKIKISERHFAPVCFTEKFHEMCDSFTKDKFAPFKEASLYREVYSVYCD